VLLGFKKGSREWERDSVKISTCISTLLYMHKETLEECLWEAKMRGKT
jgi:hypothetical protein